MWEIKPVEKTKEVDGFYTAVATWHDEEFGDFVIGYKVNETEESQKEFALYIDKYRDEWIERKKAELAAEVVKIKEITDKVSVALNPLVK